MAGLAAAIFLRRAGKDVLVLERSKTPAFKTCAGGITPRGATLAKRLGLNLGPLVYTYVMENNTPPWHYNRFEADIPVMAVADRQVIDRSVFQQALAEGVAIEHAAVEGLDYARGKFSIKTNKGSFSSRILVGADGANSLTRRAFKSKAPYYARAAMYRRIETDRYQDRIIFDGGCVPGGYGWVFPTGHGTVNAGVYDIGKNVRGGLKQGLDDYIRARFGATSPSGQARGGVIPWGGHSRPAHGAPVLLVGDAGGFADPLTGEGIYQALYSAKAAADAIIHNDHTTVRRSYYRRLFSMRVNVKALEWFCPLAHTPFGARMGARLLGKPWVYAPAAEGLLQGLNSSSIAAMYPLLFAYSAMKPRIKNHRSRSYCSLEEHSTRPF
ncbi:MAG: geranylgeranyl reductase family protein [Desulfatibacillum sp.]|nr:geranylgeranyl reductase family protein [Desulfatibacillum sp.]